MSKYSDELEAQFKDIGCLKKATEDLIKQNARKVREKTAKEVQIK